MASPATDGFDGIAPCLRTRVRRRRNTKHTHTNKHTHTQKKKKKLGRGPTIPRRPVSEKTTQNTKKKVFSKPFSIEGKKKKKKRRPQTERKSNPRPRCRSEDWTYSLATKKSRWKKLFRLWSGLFRLRRLRNDRTVPSGTEIETGKKKN